jgi:hypothetical protein
VPPFVAGKAPETAPDAFKATAFHSGNVPAPFTTNDL